MSNSITFSASASAVPGTNKVITTHICCNQTTNVGPDSVSIGYTWALSTGASGSGSSLTTNLLAPGIYVCTFSVSATNAVCGVVSTNLIATGTVVKVDLDIIHPAGGELTEEAEDSDGGFVAVKRDDDTPVTQLLLRKIEPLALGGQYKVAFSSSKLKVWQNSNGTGAVISDQTTFDATVITTLYLEGLSESSSPGGETIDLKWTNGSTEHSCDSVKIVVVEAEFGIYSAIFIPYQWVDIPFLPWYAGRIALGDDRSYDPSKAGTYRVSQRVIVIPCAVLDADGIKAGTKSNVPGTSVNYDEATSIPFPGSPYSTSNRLFPAALAEPLIPANKGAPYMVDYGVASTADMHVDEQTRTSQNVIKLKLHGSADEPIITPSSSIDWDFDITVDATDPIHPRYKIEGSQDGFPAYEVYIEDSNGSVVPMYQWSPPAGRTASSLVPVVDDETLPAGLEDEIP